MTYGTWLQLAEQFELARCRVVNLALVVHLEEVRPVEVRHVVGPVVALSAVALHPQEALAGSASEHTQVVRMLKVLE
jgi:hypothetical protein